MNARLYIPTPLKKQGRDLGRNVRQVSGKLSPANGKLRSAPSDSYADRMFVLLPNDRDIHVLRTSRVQLCLSLGHCFIGPDSTPVLRLYKPQTVFIRTAPKARFPRRIKRQGVLRIADRSG